MRALWAVIGLSFFNLVVVLGPSLGLVGLLLGGWVTGIALIASPLLVLGQAALINVPVGDVILDLFASLALAGVGIFIVIGMVYITRIFAKLFVGYLRFNARLVLGGMN